MYYSVVYYHEDGVIHICKESEIKYVKGKMVAQYLDGSWYKASSIFTTNSLQIAIGVVDQLYSEKVVLNKTDLKKEQINLKYAKIEMLALPSSKVTDYIPEPISCQFAKLSMEPCLERGTMCAVPYLEGAKSTKIVLNEAQNSIFEYVNKERLTQRIIPSRIQESLCITNTELHIDAYVTASASSVVNKANDGDEFQSFVLLDDCPLTQSTIPSHIEDSLCTMNTELPVDADIADVNGILEDANKEKLTQSTITSRVDDSLCTMNTELHIDTNVTASTSSVVNQANDGHEFQSFVPLPLDDCPLTQSFIPSGIEDSLYTMNTELHIDADVTASTSAAVKEANDGHEFQSCVPLVVDEWPNVNVVNNILLEDVTTQQKKTKQEFCIFCMSLKSNISRHFTTVHKNEEEVQKFLYLPNKSVERVKLIEELRKRGQLVFNTNDNLNQGKYISVSRRNADKHDTDHYRVCPSCKGYYAKNSIRKHRKLCAPQYAGSKCTGALGKRLEGRIHHSACDILKNTILPYLRNDTVSSVASNDPLAIASANSWCKKYKLQKDHAMIRSRLRYIGRFLIKIRSITDHVKQLSDIFNPQLYPHVVKAINEVAKFKENDSVYSAPSSAHNLGGLIKKIAVVHKIQLITDNKTSELTNLDNFLTVFNHEISNDVNRTVRENLCQSKRRKGVILPEIGDIQKLSCYLHHNVQKYEVLCRENLTLFNYKQLASYLLIDLQVFNRRRAGELERLLIGDYEAHVSDLESPGYVRVDIRGKLMRTVPLLISHLNNNCIKLLLQSRPQLGIRDDNPFVFALPSADDRPKHIRACQLLRQYSDECGVSEPNLLRGTLLRKHAATHASKMDFSDSQVENLANHLGHETKIFREIYSQPIIKKQLAVATFLENAQGLQNNEENTVIDTEQAVMVESLSDPVPNTSNKRAYDYADEDSPPEKRYLQSEELTLTSTPTNAADLPRRKSSGGRHSWSAEEKRVVEKLFSTHIKSKSSPSFFELCEAKDNAVELKDLSETQILGCVNNMIAQEKRKLFGEEPRKAPKRWTQNETEIVQNHFQNCITENQLPSLMECKDLIKKNPELLSRTPQMVKAWVNNYIRRLNKKI